MKKKVNEDRFADFKLSGVRAELTACREMYQLLQEQRDALAEA